MTAVVCSSTAGKEKNEKNQPVISCCYPFKKKVEINLITVILMQYFTYQNMRLRELTEINLIYHGTV